MTYPQTAKIMAIPIINLIIVMSSIMGDSCLFILYHNIILLLRQCSVSICILYFFQDFLLFLFIIINPQIVTEVDRCIFTSLALLFVLCILGLLYIICILLQVCYGLNINKCTLLRRYLIIGEIPWNPPKNQYTSRN